MCSCCCFFFPFAVFASQHGDFGIAAELRCQGNELCCRTAYTWDLESLSVCILSSPLFIPPFSQVFFGVAEASRTPLLFFLLLSSAFHPQKYSHIHNETHTVENKICVLRFYHFLPFPPPHFIFSVDCYSPFHFHSHVGVQIWLCRIPQSLESPDIYITVSS